MIKMIFIIKFNSFISLINIKEKKIPVFFSMAFSRKNLNSSEPQNEIKM
jgi:hypothetical protein